MMKNTDDMTTKEYQDWMAGRMKKLNEPHVVKTLFGWQWYNSKFTAWQTFKFSCWKAWSKVSNKLPRIVWPVDEGE